jgi:hypothetical protein
MLRKAKYHKTGNTKKSFIISKIHLASYMRLNTKLYDRQGYSTHGRNRKFLGKNQEKIKAFTLDLKRTECRHIDKLH